MTLLPDTREGQLSQLLGSTVEQLDIAPEAFAAAESCYLDLGDHLSDDVSAQVYVQGSFLLGTVVRPHHRQGEYDLDLVCRLDIDKTSITQAELKERVGDALESYADDHDGLRCESPAELTEGRRSWCLHYGAFHMDVLPAIPNPESASPTAIQLTDRNLRLWQHSDPLAYVEWFRAQCAKEFAEERAVLAKAYGSVDDVPKHRVRTPLHRVVQVLKRHRDIHFEHDPDDRPPSSLITTLAGLAYEGERDLATATIAAVQRMPALVERRNGRFWIENPVCPDENFADKWNEYELRRRKFERWLETVERDLEDALYETKGAIAVHQRVAKALGDHPVQAALKSLGAQTSRARENGAVRFGTGGLLTTTAAAPAVPKHRFFGGDSPR